MISDASRDAPVESSVSSPAELPPTEEPVTTGTVFLMIIFLMLIGGFWGMMYLMLLHR